MVIKKPSSPCTRQPSPVFAQGRSAYLPSKGPHCCLGSQIILEFLGDNLLVDVQVRDPIFVHGRGRHVGVGAQCFRLCGRDDSISLCFVSLGSWESSSLFMLSFGGFIGQSWPVEMKLWSTRCSEQVTKYHIMTYTAESTPTTQVLTGAVH